MWWLEVALMVIGVLLIVSLDQAQFGAMLITVSNTFMIGLLWYGVYDYCRHSSIPSYLVLAAVWAAHLLPREAGRYLVFLFGPQLGQSMLVIAVLVCLLALSMAVMLRGSQPKARRFFATFGTPDARKDALERTVVAEAAPAQCVSEEMRPTSAAAATEETPSEQDARDVEGATFEDGLRARCSALQARFDLTDRETDMVWYLAQGRSKAFISQELHLSENTVKSYTRNVYSKLCIHSKQELLDALSETH